VLVVVAVIALDAVVAREVALQGREHRQAELVLAFAKAVEERADVLPVGFTALDDEPVFGERVDRIAIVDAGHEIAPSEAIQQVGNVLRHYELGIREGVHQEHFVPLFERDTDVED
jgi:hypothetical protein